MDSLVPTKETEEPITVIPAVINSQLRIAVPDHASISEGVAETRRVFGISRTRNYQ
jgi:hypothetical protein